MATPFAHTHVSHVSKTRRRRSQSLSIPNSDQDDTSGESVRREKFLAQLRKERQDKGNGQHEEQESQDEQEQDEDDHYQPVVTRVPGENNRQSTKKQTSSTTAIPVLMKSQLSSTTSKTSATDENEEDQPVVIRIAHPTTNMSMNKQTSSTGAMSTALKKEISLRRTKTSDVSENEQYNRHEPQVIRIPRAESTMSLRRQILTTTGKNSNLDSSTIYKSSYLDSSQKSANPLISSSSNIMTKSEIFDQEFHLDGIRAHARRNDVKSHGSINISGQDKYYTDYDRKLSAKSSASFMASIIAIVIAVIAFAFGLTSLILVLLLRSTVAAQLGTNSTSSESSSTPSSGSGTLPSACSAYTTVDDPTRSVNAPGYGLGCDNTAPFTNQSSPVWIRFVGTGGTTLPLTAPGMNLCGSTGTGWYDGTMPSSDETINGTACFTWYTSTCRFSQSISVANCGSFYIYLLPPAPACMMRYCTN